MNLSIRGRKSSLALLKRKASISISSLILMAMVVSVLLCNPSLPLMVCAFTPKTQVPIRFHINESNLRSRHDQLERRGAIRSRTVNTYTTSLSSTTDEQMDSTTATQHQQQQLSVQDRILKEILGIEPETLEERNARIKKRQETLDKAKNEKRKNVTVAVLAFAAAILNYAWQYTHPITSLTLLNEMQQNSADLTVIGNNGKPTVVDFWAPWCENCKEAAPTLFAIEEEYKDQVNFVMVNGDLGENWPIIERFGVDAIPHLAMVSSDGVVETALIGPIPRAVLRADLDVMLENGKRITDGEGGTKGKINLPYKMYDAFRSRPDMNQLSF